MQFFVLPFPQFSPLFIQEKTEYVGIAGFLFELKDQQISMWFLTFFFFLLFFWHRPP